MSPTPSPVDRMSIVSENLPLKLKGNVEVQQRARELVEALASAADVQGVGGKVRVVLHYEPEIAAGHTASRVRSPILSGASEDDQISRITQQAPQEHMWTD